MKILRNDLKNELKIRVQKDFPIPNIEFIDITPLVIDSKLFDEITSLLCEDVKRKNANYLVLPEARGFLFGSAVASEAKLGVIPIRKAGKLPPMYVATTFEYEKEYGKDVFELPKLIDDESYENKNFYIIDDIYATGNTIKAIQKVVEDMGGNVCGVGVVMNIKNLNNDEDVFSIIDIEEE